MAKKKDKEEVCETFEVKKENKEKIVKTCGNITTKHATKKQLKDQDKLLKNIFIWLGIIVLLILLGSYFINSVGEFKHRGVDWEIVREGELIFYQTGFPVYGNSAQYIISIRNDVRKLDKTIPFEGNLTLGAKFNDGFFRLIYDIETLECEGKKKGDDVIAIANMFNLEVLKIKFYRDLNATCDPYGRYMYLEIISGEESKITQIGRSCYELQVNDCEILDVTEKFMNELFVRYNE